MKTELKPYPAYKPSENLWIGEIPAEWGAWRLRFVAPLQGGFAFPSSQFSFEGIPVVRMTNLKRGAIDLTDAACVPTGPDRFALKPRDLLLGMSGSIGETGSLGNYAEVGESDVPSFLNQRVGRFLPKSNLNRGFLKYLLQSKLFTEPLLIDVTGTAQFNISPGQVGNIRAPLPDRTTQERIAAFLDWETAKIDRLMEVRRKQVERLQEQRTAVIHHAVTKGLDPNAKMKPSGVEWLGRIPSDWQLLRLGNLATVKARLGWRGLTASEYVDEGNIFLSTPDIKGSEIDFENANYITDERYFESPEIMLKVGDVLLVKDGATLGIVNLVRHLPARATVNGSIAVIRPKNGLAPEFLCYFLKSQYFQNLVQEVKGGMGVPHLFQSDIVKFKVLIPPPDEQARVVKHLDIETTKLDHLADKYRRELDLLVEYRASLISHAVTGKIDVRGLVPPVTEESP